MKTLRRFAFIVGLHVAGLFAAISTAVHAVAYRAASVLAEPFLAAFPATAARDRLELLPVASEAVGYASARSRFRAYFERRLARLGEQVPGGIGLCPAA